MEENGLSQINYYAIVVGDRRFGCQSHCQYNIAVMELHQNVVQVGIFFHFADNIV